MDTSTLPGSSCPGCPVTKPGGEPNDGSGADSGFPLDEHRQVALALPSGHLYLTSDDAPQIESPRIGAFPPEFNTIIGATSDHRLYGANLQTSDTTATTSAEPKDRERPPFIDCVVQGILENPTPAARFRIHAPRVGKVNELLVSPQGDRLVWAIRYTREPYSWVAWAAKNIKFTTPYTQSCPALSVWTTDIHGGHPHHIGEEAVVPDASGAVPLGTLINELPANFAWSADAKEIQFSFDSGRYAVDAPRS